MGTPAVHKIEVLASKSSRISIIGDIK